MTTPPTPRFVTWHRQGAASLLGAYPMRMMLALAASLLVVGLCFHLPYSTAYHAVGWQPMSEFERPLLDMVDVRSQLPQQPAAGAPITRFGEQEEPVEDGENDDAVEIEELPEPAPTPTRLKVRQAVLDFAENQPTIIGGMGAYYIHIEYPREAIEAGIQGRLILVFVVDTEGRPNEIEVLRSLHPLCDSSAVQALRHTRFVPGRQNGEAVPVRMRLPVQFKLVDAIVPRTDSTGTSSPPLR